MPKRHAATPAELEELLLDGFLTGAPVEEEITAETARACEKHAELIQPVAAISTQQLPVPGKKPV